MKTISFFLLVFLTTTFSNYPQNRNKETEKQTDNNSDKGVKEVLHTPPALNDNNTRDTPRNPPVRDPGNGNSKNTPPPRRPISQPPNINKVPIQQGVNFVPLPIFDSPPAVEPDYTYPIETTPAEEFNQNYEDLGLSQFNQEDYYDALTSFQFALTIDTLNYPLYYYIGITEIEIERYDDAILDLTIFIDNVIENRMGFYQRGLANFYSGNKDAAFDDLIIADKYQVDEAKVILKKYFDYF